MYLFCTCLIGTQGPVCELLWVGFSGMPNTVLLPALLPVPPKLPKSSAADKLQRQINANTLRGVFELIFEPLKDTTLEGVPIDSAEGSIGRCFPILSGWIADHMENATLHGIKSNACTKCEVPPEELGTGANSHRARDYARYKHYKRENLSLNSESDDACDTYETLGIKTGQNVFQGLERVSTPDLHMPDLLHTIYLGLFKHMMDWIQGFLKKHSRQQAFDDAWKALPPYPGFLVPNKAYREVTQWQGKEMRNLGCCLLGVLAVALRQPDNSQRHSFKRALPCVRSLCDFTIMAQYRSHTAETIQYMEDYAERFHETKDIFLEFRVSKRTQAKADELRRELRRQRTLVNQTVTKSTRKRRRIQEQYREEENDQRMDLINAKSHFNFVKMHLISHFGDHIYQFGNIPMFPTEYGELTHKEQIKDGYQRSNKNNLARQILSSYRRQHAIRMRLLNLEFLRRGGADPPAEVVEHLAETLTAPSAPPVYRRMLKRHCDDVQDVADFGRAFKVSPETICRELIRYS